MRFYVDLIILIEIEYQRVYQLGKVDCNTKTFNTNSNKGEVSKELINSTLYRNGILSNAEKRKRQLSIIIGLIV